MVTKLTRPALALLSIALMAAAPSVTTWHSDNLRTGWNPNETVLTTANVTPAYFGLQHQVALDQQVDAQPLFVTGQKIKGQGSHNVVYVATENDTVYAIDADSGTILLSRTLGPAVPGDKLGNQGCSNNSSSVGINSTPVIDLKSGTIYVMAYTYEKRENIYRLHALDLSDLSDQVAPAEVSGSSTLQDGKTMDFQARFQRQRPALLETAGNIYAGFGSFCDLNTNQSRGWVLGWQAGSLAPLPANYLNDKRKKTRNSYLLSSLWMSGAGIASDDKGSLFFLTGNSDPTGNAYNKKYNLEESFVRLSTDLTTVEGFITPVDYAKLDSSDNDFGAGGVLLLPKQAGHAPPMAVIAGKTDYVYLVNRDHLHGLSDLTDVLGYYQNYGCFCVASYFTASDGIGRVLTSTGSYPILWQVQISPTPALTQSVTGPDLNAGQDPGFFTSISSNGTQPGTAVIWAVPHPQDSDPNHTITAYAFDPNALSAPIWQAAAGTWPVWQSANANIVPTAAGGHLFVASYYTLAIFGPTTNAVAFVPPAAHVAPPFAGSKHLVSGTVLATDADTLTLRDRTGKIVHVDIAQARHAGMFDQAGIGHASLVRGDSYDQSGRLIATAVVHAKPRPISWWPDR